MIKVVGMAVIVLFYAGCSTENETAMSKSLEQMSGISKELQKTEKISIKDANETKIFVTATYLNGKESLFDDKEKIREKFIVGIYQADDLNNTGLINDEQNLTINLEYPETDRELSKKEEKRRRKGIDKLPLLVKKLSLDDPKLKNIPMVNKWSSYYYVEFPHTKKEKFDLTYQNKVYGIKPPKKKKKKKTVHSEKKDKKSNTPDTKKEKVQGNGVQSIKKDRKTTSSEAKKKEKPRYKKYKLHFSKKYKYIGRRHVNLFGR